MSLELTGANAAESEFLSHLQYQGSSNIHRRLVPIQSYSLASRGHYPCVSSRSNKGWIVEVVDNGRYRIEHVGMLKDWCTLLIFHCVDIGSPCSMRVELLKWRVLGISFFLHQQLTVRFQPLLVFQPCRALARLPSDIFLGAGPHKIHLSQAAKPRNL